LGVNESIGIQLKFTLGRVRCRTLSGTLERWKTEGKWFFLKIFIEIHSSEIVLEKPSAGFELKNLGFLISMKLGKVVCFKNKFLVNGSLNNCVRVWT
jgi:hypothetical protein